MSGADSPVAVYSPEPQLKHPGTLIRSMVHDLMISRELAWRLMVRNLKAQYRQTILGWIWAFVAPAATAGTFVFLGSRGVLSVGDTEVPYAVYVLIGTVLWQGFAESLASPLKIVTASRSVLTKVNFPREALLLAGFGQVLVFFAVRIPWIVGVMLLYRVPFPSAVLIAPVGVLALILLGTVVGLLLTPIGVLFQDVEQGLTLVLMVWFFLTPVVYPPPVDGGGASILSINPVSPLLVTTRELLTTGSVTSWAAFAAVSAAVMIVLFAAWILYRLAMPHLIARMPS
jgi:lipopolysaccharide transport system permease protein